MTIPLPIAAMVFAGIIVAISWLFILTRSHVSLSEEHGRLLTRHWAHQKRIEKLERRQLPVERLMGELLS
jgi:hypothetical protein